MKSCLTAPRGLMQVDGKLVMRGCGVAHRSKPLVCWRSHVVEERPYLVEGVGIPPCPHCDLAVYVVSMHGGYQLRADLTAEEALEIRGRAWRLGDVLKYVGAEMAERVA